MPSGDVFGFIGGAIMTLGFVPQVVRVYRLKSAREISLVFAVLFTLGAFAWLAYGISFRLTPIIFWNAITIVLAIALLLAKLRYGR